jgi:hypothetical protein
MKEADNKTANVTKIILHCPIEDRSTLPELVETWITRGISLIAIHGEECESVHDLVDELIVGDGSNDGRFIVTTWHENEPLEDVIQFAETFGDDGSIEHVRL